MKNTVEWLHFLMEGSMVVRFHARPTLVPITDGQHSHGVAMLCWYLTDGKPSVNLLMAALTHDLAEQAASDVSAPAKRALGLRDKLEEYERSFLQHYGMHVTLTKEEILTLYLADQMEGMLSLVRERAYGNLFSAVPFYKWVKWLSSGEVTLPPQAVKLFEAIETMYSRSANNVPPGYDVHSVVE